MQTNLQNSCDIISYEQSDILPPAIIWCETIIRCVEFLFLKGGGIDVDNREIDNLNRDNTGLSNGATFDSDLQMLFPLNLPKSTKPLVGRNFSLISSVANVTLKKVTSNSTHKSTSKKRNTS